MLQDSVGKSRLERVLLVVVRHSMVTPLCSQAKPRLRSKRGYSRGMFCATFSCEDSKICVLHR